MSTPESKVKARINSILSQAKNVWWFMPVQNGMGKATLDYIGAHCGHAFAIEAKAPGKLPTPRQMVTMQDMLKAGITVFIVDGTDQYPFEPLIQWFGFTSEVKDALEVFEIPYGVK